MTDRGLAAGMRSRRLGSEPRRSVVLASIGPRQALEELLATLLPACGSAGIELVVARRCPASELVGLQARYKDALFMPAPDGSSPREVRALGIAAAEGDVVYFIEDSAPPTESWLRSITSPWPTDAA